MDPYKHRKQVMMTSSARTANWRASIIRITM